MDNYQFLDRISPLQTPGIERRGGDSVGQKWMANTIRAQDKIHDGDAPMTRCGWPLSGRYPAVRLLLNIYVIKKRVEPIYREHVTEVQLFYLLWVSAFLVNGEK